VSFSSIMACKVVAGITLSPADGVLIGAHDFLAPNSWTLEVIETSNETGNSRYTCTFVHKTTGSTTTALRSTCYGNGTSFENCPESMVRQLVLAGDDLQDDGTLFDYVGDDGGCQ
jgi:hypothetical protein